jgi:U32 family peptidase
MKTPELLAPVNGPEGLYPALSAGADAVYLGMKGFNARQKARNFSADELAAAVRDCRRAACRVYVTFNTLLFDDEWERAADVAGAAWEAGVDALIVQDLGAVARLRRWLPDLELHASTQMTVHHPSQLAPLADAGIRRVILARELSLDETSVLARVAGELGLGVEVFVHGALCVSYSGQCLISAFAEKRSGNRGLCAQICRRSFQVCTGAKRGKKSLPLSMRDLSALSLLPKLVAAGVEGLKIEGRLKRPEYVAGVVAVYREALDRVAAGGRGPFPDLEERLRLVYNRGFSLGGLGGEFAAEWTTGQWGGPRFLRVGAVRSVDRRRARLSVDIERLPEPGDGLALFAGEGGVPFACVVTRIFAGGEGERWIGVKALDGVMEGCPERGELFLSSSASEFGRIRKSIALWSPPVLPLRLFAAGEEGEALRVEAVLPDGFRATAVSSLPLQPAGGWPLTEKILKEQLGRLGNTAYRLERLEWSVGGSLFLPKSELNALRRRLVEELDRFRRSRRPLPGRSPDAFKKSSYSDPVNSAHFCRLAVFCSASGAAGVSGGCVERVYVSFEEILAAGVPAMPAGRRPWLAIPAVTTFPLFDAIRRWVDENGNAVAGVLAGHLGAVALAREHRLPFVADSSFNVTSVAACEEVARLGADRAALSWEVDRARAAAIASRAPLPVEVVLFGRPPMMQTGLKDLASPAGRQELRDRDGRRYRVKPWPFADGFTLEAPFFRAALSAVEGLQENAALLRLDVSGLSDGEAKTVVEGFSRVLEDPSAVEEVGETFREMFDVDNTLFDS